jgi:DNA-directed RNA polymerase specialized sigma24 family protein
MPSFDLNSPAGRAAYLIDRHYADLVRHAPGPCPSALTRATAEDAVQDVLHAIAEGRGNPPREPDPLFAYAVVCVRRRNARLVRERLRPAPRPFRPGSELAGGEDTARDVCERSEALVRARRILERAGRGTDRQIALLHLLGYGRREIAAALNESPRRVRRVVDRTQLALREQRPRRRPAS